MTPLQTSTGVLPGADPLGGQRERQSPLYDFHG